MPKNAVLISKVFFKNHVKNALIDTNLLANIDILTPEIYGFLLMGVLSCPQNEPGKTPIPWTILTRVW